MLSIFILALSLSSIPQSPCLMDDEGFFRITYNGGKIMTQPIIVSLLWVGDGWGDGGRAALRNAITSLSSRINHPLEDLGDVPTLRDWWSIVRQYRDGASRTVADEVILGADCSYSGTITNMTRNQVVQIGRSVFNETSIAEFQGKLSCTRPFDTNENTIRLMLLSRNVFYLVGESQMELIDYCSGGLEVETTKGVMTKLSWVSEPQGKDDRCMWSYNEELYLGSPNGDERIDVLIANTLAKIAEEATNWDGKGWSTDEASDGPGLSVSGVCQALVNGEGEMCRDVKRNVSFNIVGDDGYRYLVRHLWDQQISNCALKPSDFNYEAKVRLQIDTSPKSIVAVKHLKEINASADLEEEILKVSSHPNIVPLVGYINGVLGRRLLVSEFISKGSLSWNLREEEENLTWENRLAIALQISSALQKLHMHSKPPVYHGNLTSDNILINESWDAKLGGFGSANYSREDYHVSHKQTGMKEDIGSFGLLLVELLRGEIVPRSSSPCCPVFFNEGNMLHGGRDCLDRRLEIPQEENKILGLAKLGEIAKWCIIATSAQGESVHPTIEDVVLGLKQVQQLFKSATRR